MSNENVLKQERFESNEHLLNRNYSLHEQNKTSNTDGSSLLSDGDNRPTLQQGDADLNENLLQVLQNKFRSGSVKGSVFSLTIVIVGAGSLSLSYAFRNVGFVNGVLLLCLAYLCTYLSLYMLIESTTAIQTRPSFQELSKASYGNWLVKVSGFALMVNLFGSIVSYLVAIGTIVDLVYIVVFNHNDSDINKSIYTYTIIGVAAGIVLPLGLMRSIGALRFTALFGFCCVIYLGVVLVVSYFRLCHVFNDTCFWIWHHEHKLNLSFHDLFKFQIQGFLKAWPIIVFAYTCHPNVLPIYAELRNKTPTRMRKVITRALTIAILLYQMIGASGYLIFIDDTCGNILVNNFHQHPEVIVAAIAIGMSLLFTAPLLVFAFREELTGLTIGKTSVSTIPHFFITLGCVGIAALIAILVSDISVVFGFIGSTSTPTIAFILPTLFYVKLVKPRKREDIGPLRRKKILFSILTTILILASLSSLCYNIITYIDPSFNVNNKCKQEQSV